MEILILNQVIFDGVLRTAQNESRAFEELECHQLHYKLKERLVLHDIPDFLCSFLLMDGLDIFQH